MSVTDESRGVSYFMGGKTPSATGDEDLSASVREYSWQNGKLRKKKLPPLPAACAEGVAALVDGKIVVGAGVTERSGELVTLRKIFVLDPAKNAGTWRGIDFPAQARGRMHAVCGVRGGDFYLFGGRDFARDETEKAGRVFGLDFLKDAWVLSLSEGKWQRLNDLPTGLSAAPSPALPVGMGHFMILGGVSAELLQEQVALRPDVNGAGL